jgi:hypothetical protein
MPKPSTNVAFLTDEALAKSVAKLVGEGMGEENHVELRQKMVTCHKKVQYRPVQKVRSDCFLLKPLEAFEMVTFLKPHP